MQTLAAWIVAHLLLLAAIGYSSCRSPATPTGMSILSSCGQTLGLLALAIGLVQLVYGSVIGSLAFLFGPRGTAIAQGILIGTGLVTLLFTVLCFAGASIG